MPLDLLCFGRHLRPPHRHGHRRVAFFLVLSCAGGGFILGMGWKDRLDWSDWEISGRQNCERFGGPFWGVPKSEDSTTSGRFEFLKR